MTDLLTELADQAAELRRLYEAKTATAEADAAAKAAHKQQEGKLLTLMARAKQESMRPAGVGYTFTAVNDKVKGQLDDRRPFLEYGLENDPALTHFIAQWAEGRQDFERELYDALLNLSILKLAERQDLLNKYARAAHDDERPLPPGVGLRLDPYVSVTKS